MHAIPTLLLLSLTTPTQSFLSPSIRRYNPPFVSTPRISTPLYQSNDFNDDEEDDPIAEMKKAYPDLEFVDYSNPEYEVDQGVNEGVSLSRLSGDETDAEIEAMREERRRRNDEYQFETYFGKTLRNGDEFRGEWTVYKTGEELDKNEFPRLIKASKVYKIISKGKKVIVDPDAEWRVDGEIIVHEERVDVDDENKEEQEVDSFQEELMSTTYWPEEMKSGDFRGPQGNMVVGNAYSICHSTPLPDFSEDPHEGPFSNLRTEVGLHYDDMRFRIKLDYRAADTNPINLLEPSNQKPPPLYLSYMTVCRECRNEWPQDVPALFGPPGANGGLYDPPPVGCDVQATRYMMLDLEGRATTLFPYKIDQDSEVFGGNGWVVSLDWTPGDIRYQVDRKMVGGKGVKGIHRLELSEVREDDADKYRPRDGGQHMRQ